MKDVSIGTDCNICDSVFIESGVEIGNRVTIKSGVQLWEKTIIHDDVFIGPNATFTNNNFPRSKDPNRIHLGTIVKKGASIGANATILAGLTIGEWSMVAAGSVVTRDVPDCSLVLGNPARVSRKLQLNQDNQWV